MMTSVITSSISMDDMYLMSISQVHACRIRVHFDYKTDYIWVCEEDDDSRIMIIVLPEWLNEWINCNRCISLRMTYTEGTSPNIAFYLQLRCAHASLVSVINQLTIWIVHEKKYYFRLYNREKNESELYYINLNWARVHLLFHSIRSPFTLCLECTVHFFLIRTMFVVNL